LNNFRLGELLFERSFNLVLRIDFFFQFTAMYRQQQKYLKVLHEFTDSVIKARREELISEKLNSNHDESFGTKKKMALLDLLLQSTIDGQPLSDADIREEVDTFMFEGHDTTTSAISFCLYNLAKYQDIQQKVYDEVRSCVDDEVLNVTKLNDLHYLELVIKESLRLFPSVPVYARRLTEEFTANGYTFPKGCSIYISPFLMGRDENIFPDPLEFKPERFDVETTAEKVNPFAYVPFSAGKYQASIAIIMVFLADIVILTSCKVWCKHEN
jgi:cytochrome P450 family 4